MKKTSIIILLTLTMVLLVFTVACGDDSKAPSETEDSRQLDDDGDDVEAARGSDTSGAFNFDNVTFDDWLEVSTPDDDASFRGSSVDLDNMVSASDND